METTGQKLTRMREAAGLSLAKVAEAGGYSNASSVQKFFEPTYNATPLAYKVAIKLAVSLGDQVMELCEAPVASPPPTRAEDLSFLIGQIERRLADLAYTDREASMAATGSPDMIRYIKTRSATPSAMNLQRLAKVLKTDVRWLIDEEYVRYGRL